MTYLQVSVLQKWPTLFALDIRDEADNPLPLLALPANAAVDAAALGELARRTPGMRHKYRPE